MWWNGDGARGEGRLKKIVYCRAGSKIGPFVLEERRER